MSTDNMETRVADLERYFTMLVEMIRRHDQRLDEVRAEQSNADERIAALADAQIKTEEILARLTNRIDHEQSNADKRIAALAKAQIRTDEALARLTDRVDQLTDRVEQVTNQVGQVTGRVDKLADTVERYITGRNGQS